MVTTHNDVTYKTIHGTVRTKRGRKHLVPEAAGSMNTLKHTVATELGIDFSVEDKGGFSAKDCGKVGGEMVRRIIEQAQKEMFLNYPDRVH